MQLQSTHNGAVKYGLRYTDIERYKVLYVNVPAIDAGNQQNIYLPFDQDLNNAIVTGIRLITGGETAPSGVWPSSINLTSIPTPAAANKFCLTIVNRDGFKVWDRFPCYWLINTSTINQDVYVNCQFTFNPGKSFISYFDTTQAYGKRIFPIAFRYKSLIL